ncbi:MAG: biotin transporter BioY [Bacteroidota bacterium]
MSDIRPLPKILDRVIRLARDPFWDVPVKVLLSAGLMGLLAPIALGSSGPVPITLQTFVILVLSYLLGPVKALLATGIYLLAGGFGLPVFAGGSAGWAKFAGPTGGFLFAFFLAAGLTGWLASLRPKASLLWLVMVMMLGHALILAKGLVWLGIWKGWAGLQDTALSLLPGALIKSVLGGLVLWGIQAGLLFLLQRGDATSSSA